MEGKASGKSPGISEAWRGKFRLPGDVRGGEMGHVRALAALDLILATLFLIGGACFFGFYALGAHLAPEPWLESLLLGVGAIAGAALMALGVLLGLAGALLLGGPRPSSRLVQTVSVAPHIINMPFGTAFALYAIWVCWMNEPTKTLFEKPPEPLPFSA